MAVTESCVSLQGQSLMDISLAAYGTADYAYMLALHNGLVVSGRLVPGTTVFLPPFKPILDVLKNYAQRQIVPVTARHYINGEEVEPFGGSISVVLGEAGIGNWQIEVNFIIQ